MPHPRSSRYLPLGGRFDRFLARNTAHMFHSGVSIMDKDRIKGSLKQVVGRVKEAVGHAVGDKKAQQDGKAAQISGKAQNAVGSLKDTVREIFKR